MIILSEISQTKKDKYHVISLITWNRRYDTNEPINKTNRVTDIENKLIVTKVERGWGRDKLGA